VNRIGTSWLLEIARFLDVSVGFFYDDTDPICAPLMPCFSGHDNNGDRFKEPETIELVASYYEVHDAKTRESFFTLAGSLAPSAAHKKARSRRRLRSDDSDADRVGRRSSGARENTAFSLDRADCVIEYRPLGW
jgi:hypothetical protein